MALPWFGFPHSSVTVTLRAGAEEKALDLSPVVLSHWSAFFAACYRPDGNEWAPIVLDVESVRVAEVLLRAFYRFSDVLDWSEIFTEWHDFIEILGLIDMLQVHNHIISEVLVGAKHLIDGFGEVAHERDASDASFAERVLEDLVNLRVTSVGCYLEFNDVMKSATAVFGKTHSGILKEALATLSTRAGIEVLFEVIRDSEPSAAGDDAVIIVAEALRDAKEDLDALPYLEEMTRKGASAIQCEHLETRRKAMDILEEIRGDEIAGSVVLRARDKLALLMHGAILDGAKRKRESE